MSLDLISSIETRFFSEEIDDPHIDFGKRTDVNLLNLGRCNVFKRGRPRGKVGFETARALRLDAKNRFLYLSSLKLLH